MASEAELRWWDRFADVMATQWNLTPRMNRAIRTEYERDYEDFLFTPGGTLLDVGCGTGMRTHALARRGMLVDGIDFSGSQLELARRLAEEHGVRTMEFFQRDIVNDDWSGRHAQYDGMLIHALLHHLTYDELDLVFQRIRAALKPGGRVYLYEPLVTTPRSALAHALFRTVDFCWRVGLGVFLRAGRALGLFDATIARAMRDGYTGTSPDEHAILFDRLRAAAGTDFEVAVVRPFHEYSIAYAMSIMLLREPVRRPLEPFAPFVYALDQWLFRRGMWENAGMERRWILCSVKLRRAATTDGRG